MIYLDTSFVVAAFLAETASSRVEEFLRLQRPGDVAVSHLTRIEVFATLSRLVRMGTMTASMAAETQQEFQAVTAETFTMLVPSVEDFNLAAEYVRRHETGLRAPDALHLAIASNHGARAIYTLDLGMRKAGRLLGLPVRAGIRSA